MFSPASAGLLTPCPQNQTLTPHTPCRSLFKDIPRQHLIDSWWVTVNVLCGKLLNHSRTSRTMWNGDLRMAQLGGIWNSEKPPGIPQTMKRKLVSSLTCQLKRVLNLDQAVLYLWMMRDPINFWTLLAWKVLNFTVTDIGRVAIIPGMSSHGVLCRLSRQYVSIILLCIPPQGISTPGDFSGLPWQAFLLPRYPPLDIQFSDSL